MSRKGENIRKRKDGRWEGRYSLYSQGKEKPKVCSVYGRNYKEVREKLIHAKFAAKELLNQNASECTVIFSRMEEEWISCILETHKYSTYIKYRQIYEKYLSDLLEGQKLDKLTAEFMETEVLPCAVERFGTLSDSTEKSIYSVANQILSYASRKYRIAVNPVKRERRWTSEKRNQISYFNAAEQNRLMNYLQKEMDLFKLGVAICLYTGIRLGELCSLKWEDIDLDTQTIHISSTVQRLPVLHEEADEPKTTLMETAPKSVCSKREIPICDKLLLLLQQFQHGERYVIGKARAVEPRTYQKKFAAYLKEADIPYRSFHTLRHTFASSCAANGTDAKALSEILGHSSVQITLNRYVHPSMDTKRHLLNMLYTDFEGQNMGQSS